MVQEILNFEEFIVFVIQVHIIPQNIFLMQNKIFNFPTKIKKLLRKIKNSCHFFFLTLIGK